MQIKDNCTQSRSNNVVINSPPPAVRHPVAVHVCKSIQELAVNVDVGVLVSVCMGQVFVCMGLVHVMNAEVCS